MRENRFIDREVLLITDKARIDYISNIMYKYGLSERGIYKMVENGQSRNGKCFDMPIQGVAYERHCI